MITNHHAEDDLKRFRYIATTTTTNSHFLYLSPSTRARSSAKFHLNPFEVWRALPVSCRVSQMPVNCSSSEWCLVQLENVGLGLHLRNQQDERDDTSTGSGPNQFLSGTKLLNSVCPPSLPSVLPCSPFLPFHPLPSFPPPPPRLTNIYFPSPRALELDVHEVWKRRVSQSFVSPKRARHCRS